MWVFHLIVFRVAWALEVAVGAAGLTNTTWWQGFTIAIEFEKQFAAAPDEAGYVVLC